MGIGWPFLGPRLVQPKVAPKYFGSARNRAGRACVAPHVSGVAAAITTTECDGIITNIGRVINFIWVLKTV